MKVDVVPLPQLLQPHHLKGRAVVVFDVLRATTSMATALAAGASEVRAFGTLDAAKEAAQKSGNPNRLLCGEQNCVRPDGFDLGNSPLEFIADRVKGKSIFMCTTNGTRALLAARGATRCFAAALINRSATARVLRQIGLDVTLLCSGTNGEIAAEDLVGAGAVTDALGQVARTESAEQYLKLFREYKSDLPARFRGVSGGINIIRAGLEPDIDFAARLDVFDVVAEVTGDPPVARSIMGS